jgi:hypothetical protein
MTHPGREADLEGTVKMLPVFPFFVGCARSGTTLVRAIFSSHPDMAIPDETHYFSEMLKKRGRYDGEKGFVTEPFLADLFAHPLFPRWILPEEQVREAMTSPPASSYADAVRRVYILYARSKGKHRYGDKTPRNVVNIRSLAADFPEARFVHIIRDGRDVAMSLIDRRWGARSIVKAARFWRGRVKRGREEGRALMSPRYMEIRYEDLLEDTGGIVRSVCSFIDLRFDPAMLRYYEDSHRIYDGRPGRPRAGGNSSLYLPPTKGLRDWRTQMSSKDLAIFELVAGDLLDELGYERGSGRPSPWIRGNVISQMARAAGDSLADRLLRRKGLGGR